MAATQRKSLIGIFQRKSLQKRRGWDIRRVLAVDDTVWIRHFVFCSVYPGAFDSDSTKHDDREGGAVQNAGLIQETAATGRQEHWQLALGLGDHIQYCCAHKLWSGVLHFTHFPRHRLAMRVLYCQCLGYFCIERIDFQTDNTCIEEL